MGRTLPRPDLAQDRGTSSGRGKGARHLHADTPVIVEDIGQLDQFLCRKPLPSLFLARTPSENAASSAAGPESAAISASIARCLNATGPDRARAAARDAGQRSARQLTHCIATTADPPERP